MGLELAGVPHSLGGVEAAMAALTASDSASEASGR
jgi:hypothetical protein